MTELQIVPIVEVKAVVDLLAEIGVTPIHLQVDANHVNEPRPLIQVWAALGAEPYAGHHYEDHRDFSALVVTDRARIRIACTSRSHHPDWEPRQTGGDA